VSDPDNAGHGWHLWADPDAQAEWWADAACAGADPDWFFPEKRDPWKVANAKRVCNGCPVLEPCRDYAMPKRLLDGIWGGLTAGERDRLRRANRRAR
jgi:WhiB family redox-sensing transcriptional regulator